MTLHEREAVIGVSEQAFGERVLGELVGMQEKQGLRCATCGGQLRNKGKRLKRIVSLRGEVDVQRNSYECATCEQGYFPPR